MLLAHVTWPGWSPERTLVLPVPVSLWAPPERGVTLDGVAFEPKAELHVTLVGGELGVELHAAVGERVLIETSRAAFEGLDWSFVRGGGFLLLRKEGLLEGERKVARSVIELVEMPAMTRFHFALGTLLGRELAVPPPHVTLFTAGRARGIGMANRRQLRAYGVRKIGGEELGLGAEAGVEGASRASSALAKQDQQHPLPPSGRPSPMKGEGKHRVAGSPPARE